MVSTITTENLHKLLVLAFQLSVEHYVFLCSIKKKEWHILLERIRIKIDEQNPLIVLGSTIHGPICRIVLPCQW